MQQVGQVVSRGKVGSAGTGGLSRRTGCQQRGRCEQHMQEGGAKRTGGQQVGWSALGQGEVISPLNTPTLRSSTLCTGVQSLAPE